MFKRMLEKLNQIPLMPDALLLAVIGFELGFLIAATILGY